MKFKEHTRQFRDKVVQKFKAGLGYTKISQALNISRNTVQSIIQKKKENGTTLNRPRYVRPPKLKAEQGEHQSEMQPRVSNTILKLRLRCMFCFCLFFLTTGNAPHHFTGCGCHSFSMLGQLLKPLRLFTSLFKVLAWFCTFGQFLAWRVLK